MDIVKRFSTLTQKLYAKTWGKYLLLFITIYVMYFFLSLSLYVANDKGATIRTLMLIAHFALFFYGYKLYQKKSLTYDKIIMLLFISGFILRLGYGTYTYVYTRQHDLGRDEFDVGHVGYIANIFYYFKLPDSNAYQFYHPPLHHIVSAIFMRVNEFIFQIKDFTTILSTVKILTIFYSSAILITIYEILKELKLPKKVIIFAFAICAVHPTFIILSPSINNDIMSIMFMFFAMLYTIRWYKNPSYLNIILIALSIGLGMMTKLSAGIIAPVTAIIFLIRWIKSYKENKFFSMVPQFILFALICLPLALIYPIRNYLLFDQSFTYVFKVTNPALYTGDRSIWERFIIFPIHDFFHNLWASPGYDYNIWIYILKCSVFGEYSYWQGAVFALFLLLFNCILAPLSLYAMFYVFIKLKGKLQFTKWLLGGFYLIIMGVYINFNIEHPFGCTMDFRYIVPTVLIGSVFLGLMYQDLKEGKLKILIRYSLIGFYIMTVLFYSTCV